MNFITFFYCSFSLLAQRKRTKRKGSLSLGPPSVDYPLQRRKYRALRNSLRSNSPRADPIFSALQRLREMAPKQL
jgi:hypothetical protein